MFDTLLQISNGKQGAAEYQLSIEYEKGLYTTKNPQEAERYEQIAIDKNEPNDFDEFSFMDNPFCIDSNNVKEVSQKYTTEMETIDTFKYPKEDQ